MKRNIGYFIVLRHKKPNKVVKVYLTEMVITNLSMSMGKNCFSYYELWICYKCLYLIFMIVVFFSSFNNFTDNTNIQNSFFFFNICKYKLVYAKASLVATIIRWPVCCCWLYHMLQPIFQFPDLVSLEGHFQVVKAGLNYAHRKALHF